MSAPGPGVGRTPVAIRRVGFVAGPLLALVVGLALPEAYLDAAGARQALPAAAPWTAALLAWMATWWLTEAVELPATALLPLVVLPLSGAVSLTDAAAPYASPVIYLFLGGFLLALAMQRWRLDRRIALFFLRRAGTRPARLVGGFMLPTALLSACVSNTATVAMMLPIATSVLALLRPADGEPGASPRAGGEPAARNLHAALLLGIAYAASIGGMATVIGTPPNGFLVQYLESELDIRIGFLRWLSIGLPLALLFLPITWWLLTRVLYPVGGREVPGGRRAIEEAWRRLGPMRYEERATMAVFFLAVTGWLVRPLVARWVPGLSDAGIGIGAGLLLFVVPAGRPARDGREAEPPPERGALLDWATARGLPWGVLLLFGGGLSLAAAIRANGITELVAAQTSELGASPFLLTLGVTAGMVYLTELTSNTASAATVVPILASIAPGLGLHPLQLVVPATLAASCAFMLPVATPPNAIVFGSGLIGMPQMVRAGFWLNLVAIVLVTAVTYGIVLPLLAL